MTDSQLLLLISITIVIISSLKQCQTTLRQYGFCFVLVITLAANAICVVHCYLSLKLSGLWQPNFGIYNNNPIVFHLSEILPDIWTFYFPGLYRRIGAVSLCVCVCLYVCSMGLCLIQTNGMVWYATLIKCTYQVDKETTFFIATDCFRRRVVLWIGLDVGRNAHNSRGLDWIGSLS